MRCGHAPGHVRDMFCNDTIDAFFEREWGEPEPTVTLEGECGPEKIKISKACGLLWACNDVIPGSAFYRLRGDGELDIRRQTYSACAQAMLPAIQEQNRRGHIYILQLSKGVLKIGTTKRRPDERAAEWKLTLLAYARARHSTAAERTIHRYLAKLRLGRYELFKIGMPEALQALEALVGTPVVVQR
jgi:hypothetical protein